MSSETTAASGSTSTMNISAMVESLIAGGGDRNVTTMGWILSNDPQGLCLSVKGSVKGSRDNVGVYSNLVRLASQLPSSGSSDRKVAPLITIKTAMTAILVKEYAGHGEARPKLSTMERYLLPTYGGIYGTREPSHCLRGWMCCLTWPTQGQSSS